MYICVGGRFIYIIIWQLVNGFHFLRWLPLIEIEIIYNVFQLLVPYIFYVYGTITLDYIAL